MTEEQWFEMKRKLDVLKRYSDLHEDSLHMLTEWCDELKYRECNKIVDINEFKRWRYPA